MERNTPTDNTVVEKHFRDEHSCMVYLARKMTFIIKFKVLTVAAVLVVGMVGEAEEKHFRMNVFLVFVFFVLRNRARQPDPSLNRNPGILLQN